MIRERKQVINERNAKRLSKKKQKQSALTYSSSSIIMIPRFSELLLVFILVLLDSTISVSAMELSTTTKTAVSSSLSFVTNSKDHYQNYQSAPSYNNWNQKHHYGHGHRRHHRYRYHPQQQLYYKSQHGEEEQFRAPSDDDDDNNTTTENNSKNKENDAVKSIVTTKNNNNNKSESESESESSLMILQEQAAKLRMEAELLQLALQETKNNKIEREREKVDQWIEDLFTIESESSSTTKDDNNNKNNNVDILKNVDQVYQYMTDKRFSAEQIYKIFNRLSDIKIERSQGLTCESRSNCSPLMSLLLDAACKLDCTEKDNNPNKRWNYKIERILQKKLFARDWNIEYIADDEPEQQRRMK
jgi:hypothetical protein